MVFSYRDIVEYTRAAPNHYNAMSIVVSGIDDTDITSIRNFLRRQTNKVHTIAWLLADSTTESWGDCEKITIRSKKVGRPKQKVIGNKTKRHAHIVIVSTDKNECVDTICCKFNKCIAKRKSKKSSIKQPKHKQCDSMNYVPYVQRQADHLYSDGSYNWEYFNVYLYDDTLT